MDAAPYNSEHGDARTPQSCGLCSTDFCEPFGYQFLTVAPNDNLLFLCDPAAKSCCAFVCVEGGSIVGAFTHRQAMEFIADIALEVDGLLDLKDHSVSKLLQVPAVQMGSRIVDAGTAFAEAVEVLKKPQIKLVVGVDTAAGLPQGVIGRAHRRY